MHKRSLFLASLLLAAPLAAQGVNVRPSTMVDTTSTGTGLGPAVATNGTIAAIAYNDGSTGGSNTVNVVLSDGRGLTWSAPIRVDNDTTAARKFTQNDGVAIAGANDIYVCWEDERNGTTNEDLYFNASHDGGTTWVGEMMLDKGYPAGTGAIRDWRMLVEDDPAGDHVYILLTVDPTTAGNEELYLLASHDGGATFTRAQVSSLAPGTEDVDFFAMAASGTTLWVAWQGDRNGAGDDIFFQMSTDGGATWLPADVELDSSGPGVADADWEMTLSAEGSLVVVAWQEEIASTFNEELRMAVSTDGGATWGADMLIGGYTAGSADVDNPQALVHNGTILAAWEDNRGGRDEIFVASSSDNGATWTETQVTTAGGGYPRLRADQDTLLVAYSSGAYPNTALASFSHDGGATWQSDVLVSDTTGDVDFVEVAVDPLYHNALIVWLADDLGTNHVYAGGFRPQTLHAPATISAGAPFSLTAEFFGPGSEPFVGVLASLATGSHTLTDGRLSGLAADAVLSQSIDIIRADVVAGPPGSLTMVMAPDGSGANASPPFPSSLPIGTVVYMTAVSFNPTPLSLGEITDVVTTTVQ